MSIHIDRSRAWQKTYERIKNQEEWNLISNHDGLVWCRLNPVSGVLNGLGRESVTYRRDSVAKNVDFASFDQDVIQKNSFGLFLVRTSTDEYLILIRLLSVSQLKRTLNGLRTFYLQTNIRHFNFLHYLQKILAGIAYLAAFLTTISLTKLLSKNSKSKINNQ